MLVPVRLDIAFDDARLQDTFCWSSLDSQSAAQEFAQQLCRDNELPQAAVPAIVTAIQQQVQVSTAETASPRSEQLETIKLDIRVGSTILQDQFAWDVNNEEADPESLAKAYCQDLALDGSFAPLIAWHIRSQALTLRQNTKQQTSLPPVDPGLVAGQQPPVRRSKRKASKQPADAGFINTYSSGVVRQPEDWADWAPRIATGAEAVPMAAAANSQVTGPAGRQASHSAQASGPTSPQASSLSQAPHASARTHSLDQISSLLPVAAAKLPFGLTTIQPAHSSQGRLQQSSANWNQQLAQQQQQQQQHPQQQSQQQQAQQHWTLQQPQQQQQQRQQQQQEQRFVQYAQAYWSKRGMAQYGVPMPQTQEQAEHLVRVMQQFDKSSQAQAVSKDSSNQFSMGSHNAALTQHKAAGYDQGLSFSRAQESQQRPTSGLAAADPFAGLPYAY